MIDMDVPSSHYLMERVINLYFRLKGTNYVSNLSPMHSPFHLYAFTREAFEALAPRAGYEIDEIKYFISPIHHFPEFIKPFFRFWMARTKQGQQLGIHLRKPKTAVVPPDGD